MQTKEGKQKSTAKFVANIVIDVIVAIVVIFVIFVTVSAIASAGKGYTEIFGHALVSVQSDSMEGEKEDNFYKGDLLLIKVLSDEEKKDLQVGDIISFYDKTISEGELLVNSHRIVDIPTTMDGIVYYQTKGDNKPGNDNFLVPDTGVIGKYDGGKIGGLGGVIDWMRSPVGFFVCIVLPSFLIVAYFAFNLIWTIMKSKKKNEAETIEQERERIRQELLLEMQNEKKGTAGPDGSSTGDSSTDGSSTDSFASEGPDGKKDK